jgi:predicted Holliday junction resolvase-like endonuclease
MDSVIVRVGAIVLLVMALVVVVQRAQVKRLQHRLELLQQEVDHAAQVAALNLQADSVARATIERERERTADLQHTLDSLTTLLRHAPPRPARPVTAPALRDAILRAAGSR